MVALRRFDATEPTRSGIWSGRQRRHFVQAEQPMGRMLRSQAPSTGRCSSFNAAATRSHASPRTARVQSTRADLLQSHGWTREGQLQSRKRMMSTPTAQALDFSPLGGDSWAPARCYSTDTSRRSSTTPNVPIAARRPTTAPG